MTGDKQHTSNLQLTPHTNPKMSVEGVVRIAVGAVFALCLIFIIVTDPAFGLWAWGWLKAGFFYGLIGVSFLYVIISMSRAIIEKPVPQVESKYQEVVEMKLDRIEIQKILDSNLPNYHKILWLRREGIEYTLEDGKVKIKEEEKRVKNVPMNEARPEAGTGEGVNIGEYEKKMEREKPKPIKSLKDHETPESLTTDSELEINQ